MTCEAKGNLEDAANAYAAAVCISLVFTKLLTCEWTVRYFLDPANVA